MKQAMYGTVSALALMLALNGTAHATFYHHRSEPVVQGAAAFSATETDSVGNGAAWTFVTGDNEIDKHAFTGATGAFNIAQNQSVNSAVGQSMAIAAVINNTTTGSEGLSAALAFSDMDSFVGCNVACMTDMDGLNELTDHAFTWATGAFNIMQNQSVNSGVAQSMAIGAVINNEGRATPEFQGAVAVSTLDSDVVGNDAHGTGIGPWYFGDTNKITDHAFTHATGAFNVLQNESVNSSVQQGMSIGAVINNR